MNCGYAKTHQVLEQIFCQCGFLLRTKIHENFRAMQEDRDRRLARPLCREDFCGVCWTNTYQYRVEVK